LGQISPFYGGFFGEMEKQAKAGKVLKKLFHGGFESLPKQVQRGLEAEAKSGAGGPTSLFMMPIEYVAGKAVGKDKVRDAVFKYVQKPGQSVDISAGKLLRKIPGGKRLFTEKRKLPYKTKSGKNVFKEMSFPAATAPATKGMAVATPIVMGLALDKGVKKLRGKDDGKSKPPKSLR
jgi:hypothetical protein